MGNFKHIFNTKFFFTIFFVICFYSFASSQIGIFTEGARYSQFNLEFVNRLFNKQYLSNPGSSQVGFLSSEYGASRRINYGGSQFCISCVNDVHKGVDFASLGQLHQLFSPVGGRVTVANGTSGTIIIYNPTFDFSFFILHCETVSVSVGQNIEIGTLIGTTGMRGFATGIHAHCELRKGNISSASCPCNSLTNSNTYDPRIVVSLLPFCPTPEIIAPESPNNQFSHTQSINLSWKAIANAGDYRVQISESENFNTLVVNEGLLKTNSYPFSRAQPNKDYFFRVRASIPGVCTTPYSPTGNFSTNPLPPTLNLPASGALNLSLPINFSWNAVALANNYRIQVSEDPNFLDERLFKINSITGTSTQYVWDGVNSESGKIYYWRVRVSTSNGVSTFSTARSFRILAACISPAQPGTIAGLASVCQGRQQTYNVPAVSGATSYRWSIPNGWTGNSTTNSIAITSGNAGGTISVVAINNCGESVARSLAVTIGGSLPAQPGSITGLVSVCQGRQQAYNVPAVSGATSYRWSIPNGWTGSSTTNSIAVTSGNAGGNISVFAINSCGESVARSLAVSIGGTLPAQPGAITGLVSVCQGRQQTYNVPAVSGATSYRWSIPNGWTGNSTTNSIAVTSGNAGGNISVVAINSCGESVARSLAVTIGGSLPAQPGDMSGSSILCQGQSQTYSVTSISGATSYSWSLPGGWTGSSKTNTITVTAGAAGGTLSVRAVNDCGQGNERVVSIKIITSPTFNGTGNWSNSANWSDGFIPPNPLPAGNTIVINGNGECILNVPQTISKGANIRVEVGKRLRINGNLIIK